LNIKQRYSWKYHKKTKEVTMKSKNVGCGGNTDRKKEYRRENKLLKVLLSSLCVLVAMSFLLSPHLILAEEIFDLG